MVEASTPSTKDKNPCSPASETVEIVSHPEKCLMMNATLLPTLAANLQTAVGGPSGACKVSGSMKRKILAKNILTTGQYFALNCGSKSPN